MVLVDVEMQVDQVHQDKVMQVEVQLLEVLHVVKMQVEEEVELLPLEV